MSFCFFFQPGSVCQSLSLKKNTGAICLKNSVFWKSLSSCILLVPALLLLSWGRCLLLRHDLRPSLLSIQFLDFLIVLPGSHCERLTTHKTNPNTTITICSLPRKEKEANRLFLNGDLYSDPATALSGSVLAVWVCSS